MDNGFLHLVVIGGSYICRVVQRVVGVAFVKVAVVTVRQRLRIGIIHSINISSLYAGNCHRHAAQQHRQEGK